MSEELKTTIEEIESRTIKDSVKEKLVDFVKVCGLGDWHNKTKEDKQKFYDFIREAYGQGDINLPFEQFSSAIKSAHDCSDDLIKEFYQKYQKGIEILLVAI